MAILLDASKSVPLYRLLRTPTAKDDDDDDDIR